MSELLELRIDELRLQLTEASEHIAALELTVYRQQQQMELFQQQLRKLYTQMSGSAEGDSVAPLADPREDIPPHY